MAADKSDTCYQHRKKLTRALKGIEEMAFKTCTVFASWQGITLSNFQELAAHSVMNLLPYNLVTGFLCSDLNEIL